MAEQGSSTAEKTEPPSPFKLQEARKKGQVAKSIEVTSIMTFIVASLALISLWPRLLEQMQQLMSQLLAVAGSPITDNWQVLPSILIAFLAIPLPVMLLIMLGGVFGNIIQTGLMLSTHPLKPDIKKLNPITGFKRVFSLKMLFELVKSLLKVAVLLLTCWILVPVFLPTWISFLDRELYSTLSEVSRQAMLLAGVLTAGMVLSVIIDFAFVRWQFLKQMRMSKQEVKDEHKRRDGDPLIKQKRREQQQAMREKQSGMANIPSADVIITNPTHFAVALKYDRRTMVAPIVISKGVEQQALLIREQARRYNIPIIARPPLARHLYKKTVVNGTVPVDSYLSVAKTLQEAMNRKNKRAL